MHNLLNDNSILFEITEADGISRRAEPVSVGILVDDVDDVALPRCVVNEAGDVFACQTEILSRWPSGRPRWVLVTACLDLPANQTSRFRCHSDALPCPPASTELVCSDGPSQLFRFQSADGDIAARLSGNLSVVRADGTRLPTVVRSHQLETDGPVYQRFRISGQLGKRRPVDFGITATHYKPAGLVKVEVTLHNPRRAEHPGGYWDLGDPQSEWLDSATLVLETNLGEQRSVRWSEQSDGQWRETTAKVWTLTQPNSGGAQWQSRVHVDAQGAVLQGRRGYEVSFENERSHGDRATPVVQLYSSTAGVAATMCDFWEKFPSAIEVDGSLLRFHLFPQQDGQVHELQPGERTTRTIWVQTKVAFRSAKFAEEVADSVAFAERKTTLDLGWVHAPLVAVPVADGLGHGLEWWGGDADDVERQLTDELLTGERSFFWKREQVDEFGWRNFGDFWADHEEKYSDDPRPVISHYNNQYDLLQGLLRQYLKTRDRRWWRLARPLAEHIVDIDIYHTTRDRAAYNGGLFWHTSHYRDAGTCTHRTYSRQMTGDKHAVAGGGPSNEHNYTAGLLLYHHLTGCPRARHAVLSLADWVIAMDDGRQSVLAPLSAATTGKASSTVDENYHGPGRGVGNSINALVDAWQLTRETKYLDKARQLVYRMVHPDEDLDALKLLNAEMRWSYTIALQALVRYDSVVASADEMTCRYIRVCLTRYGRWMQQHERLYLDNPDQLEFPTETWPAQDMRKGVTMMLIARYLPAGDGETMYAAGERFYQAARTQLMEFASRTHTRPAAISLQQFPIAAFARAVNADAAELRPTAKTQLATAKADWPERPRLRTQKQDVKDRLRSPLGICRVGIGALRPGPWRYTIPETPVGRWLRRWGGC